MTAVALMVTDTLADARPPQTLSRSARLGPRRQERGRPCSCRERGVKRTSSPARRHQSPAQPQPVGDLRRAARALDQQHRRPHGTPANDRSPLTINGAGPGSSRRPQQAGSLSSLHASPSICCSPPSNPALRPAIAASAGKSRARRRDRAAGGVQLEFSVTVSEEEDARRPAHERHAPGG